MATPFDEMSGVIVPGLYDSIFSANEVDFCNIWSKFSVLLVDFLNRPIHQDHVCGLNHLSYYCSAGASTRIQEVGHHVSYEIRLYIRDQLVKSVRQTLVEDQLEISFSSKT